MAVAIRAALICHPLTHWRAFLSFSKLQNPDFNDDVCMYILVLELFPELSHPTCVKDLRVALQALLETASEVFVLKLCIVPKAKVQGVHC